MCEGASAAMRTDLFDFDLPPESIALRPASPRDSARMLVVQGGALHDEIVSDLPQWLAPGDQLVTTLAAGSVRSEVLPDER